MTVLATLTPFEAWYDSRKHLDEAIQRYLEHSQDLETAVTHREDSAFGRGALTEQFAEVRKEQASINPRSEKLKRASAALNRFCNQSPVFVPIRSLPFEVLVYIFALCRDECNFFPSGTRRISTTKPILAVTHVCTDWRGLAVKTPKLWTHVDIINNGPRARGQGYWDTMWLERAGSAPLSVQVAIQHDAHSGYAGGALTWLAPYLGTVSSLGLHAYSCHTLRAALVYWMSNGTPGSVQELFLTGPSEALLRPNRPEFVGRFSLGPAVLNSFLTPVRVLRLRHAPLLYSSEVYRELVHLELSYIPSEACPSTSVLSRLLSASPDFREFSPGDCNSFLKALLPLPNPSKRPMRRRRKLHTLWLVDGAFEIDDIKNIVKAYHIKTVILSIRRGPDESTSWKELKPMMQNLTTEWVLPNTVFADWDARC
ncbi:hypothetical protein FRC10_011964 [Ceratobasidium sp. 414]|nr:hypothetical protein FRC10_011964 [Ceratobasidium sp. 414]